MKSINKQQFIQGQFTYPTIILSFVLILFCGCQPHKNTENLKYLTELLPLEGNLWKVSSEQAQKDTFNLYFHSDTTGEFHLGLCALKISENPRITITYNGVNKNIKLSETDHDTIYLGKFIITTPGYQTIILSGSKSDFEQLGEINGFLLGGEATTNHTSFVRDDFYWGKRGPSVHLGYSIPEDAGQVRYFYNEITVPQGNDVLGSYFMANGFGQGYFGFQVNSETERHVLFSVWSPFHTDDPSEIPDDMKIFMKGKGEKVYTGEFGNEGSGGQSYLNYLWKAGETYGFLLKGEPQGNNHTLFTAWFYPPEMGQWQLIASFLRPETDSYLTRLHSFLENFYPKTGNEARMAYYSNQWICNTDGEWFELKNARFTADATARKRARLDYSGGVSQDAFFLKNCGFENDHTTINSHFERTATGSTPQIDFASLPGN